MIYQAAAVPLKCQENQYSRTVGLHFPHLNPGLAFCMIIWYHVFMNRSCGSSSKNDQDPVYCTAKLDLVQVLCLFEFGQKWTQDGYLLLPSNLCTDFQLLSSGHSAIQFSTRLSLINTSRCIRIYFVITNNFRKKLSLFRVREKVQQFHCTEFSHFTSGLNSMEFSTQLPVTNTSECFGIYL